MEYSEQFSQALQIFQQTPEQCVVFDSPFWTMLIDAVCETVRTTGAIDALVKENCDFLDFGICKGIFENADSIRLSIEDILAKNSPLPLHTFSKWLADQINKIKQCDKQELLIKEQWQNQIQSSKLRREIESNQTLRIAKLQSIALQSQSPNFKSDLNKITAELSLVDELQLESIRTKKALSKGAFFTAEQKRENAQRELRLTKAVEHIQAFIDTIQLPEFITEIKQINSNINEIQLKSIEIELLLEKNHADLRQIEKQQAEISLLELENRVRDELEHIRDLTRLSAKRIHVENVPVLIPGKNHFSFSKILNSFNRILEFDPRIFRNDRVAVYGKPQIIIVPGSGNAIYDWKHNLILVPLIYPGDNPILSISAAMIEYRLDTDEEKALITTYSQLPEMKNIRSSIQLKSSLIKDYSTWMISEYQGYRVLPKNVKEWFEHEIGPSKNDIFIPSAYQPYNLSSAELKKLVKATDEKIDLKKAESLDSNDLWIGSILYYLNGALQQSYDLLLILVKREVDNPMVFFNFGLIASKLFLQQNALKGFNEFITRTPQCWWTRVAGDHIRHIQSP